MAWRARPRVPGRGRCGETALGAVRCARTDFGLTGPSSSPARWTGPLHNYHFTDICGTHFRGDAGRLTGSTRALCTVKQVTTPTATNTISGADHCRRTATANGLAIVAIIIIARTTGIIIIIIGGKDWTSVAPTRWMELAIATYMVHSLHPLVSAD